MRYHQVDPSAASEVKLGVSLGIVFKHPREVYQWSLEKAQN